jgi:hypothetical protein
MDEKRVLTHARVLPARGGFEYTSKPVPEGKKTALRASAGGDTLKGEHMHVPLQA